MGNLSFLEIRDCFIKSVIDVDPETLRIREENEPNLVEVAEIEDCCF